jgi:acyl transferase domain-containing protein
VAPSAASTVNAEPIAIIGAGARLPAGVGDLDSYWRLLSEGVDAVVPHSPMRGDGRRGMAAPPGDCHWAGLLPSVDGFDAGFFGISPAEANQMDPQQRLALEVAWEAIEDAGLPIERLRARRTGVFLGLYGSDYLALRLASPETVNVYSAPGCSHSIVANRLSYLLDLRGPSLVVDTACSSSLVAVHLACRALRYGECDFAIAGGVNVIISPLSTLMTEKVLPLSPSGRCRTFDARADGIVRGEGCGMVVLERAGEAWARGRHTRAVIRGTAVNQDGRTNGLTAPSPSAQRDVMERALADAAVDPQEVVYVEAHGTGTPLGDPIEIDALREVYGAGPQPCGLGSVKTNLGHLEAAAGIAGLLKAILVLEHGAIPSHLHLEGLNPEIDLGGTRLTVPAAGMLLPPATEPHLAAVSAFGFGGTNAHAVIQAAHTRDRHPAAPPADDLSAAPADGLSVAPAEKGQTQQSPAAPELLLAFSARSHGALVELAERYARALACCDAAHASKLCAAAALERTHNPHRHAVAAADRSKLTAQLRGLRRHPAPARASRADPDRPLAFVFSGQGSQWPQMGMDLIASQPVVRREVEACDAELRALAGWSLLEEMQAPQSCSRLHETEVAQLTIAALQLGLAALWNSWGMQPSAVVGHSMGEAVAACVAKAIDRSSMLELLVHRARIIERDARGGAMVAVRLPERELGPLLDATGGQIGLAAINGPSSIIVAGEASSVERFVALADAHGARTRVLLVQYAFHSSLLDGCDEELAARLADMSGRETDVAIYSTVTGARIEPDALNSAHWGHNLRQPVRLRAAITALADDGIADFIEVGPHPTLLEDVRATLAESLDDAVACTVVGSLRRGWSAASALHASLAALYESGLDVSWGDVFSRPSTRVALPLYPWQRRRYWLAAYEQEALKESPPPTSPLASEGEGDGFALAEPRQPERPAAPCLPELSSQDRLAALTQYLREHIAEALDMEPHEVADDVPLDLLGLDSLAVVELRSRVELELSITVPLQALLEGDTVAAVAEVLAEAIAAGDLGTSQEADDRTAAMSDADVDAALASLLHQREL